MLQNSSSKNQSNLEAQTSTLGKNKYQKDVEDFVRSRVNHRYNKDKFNKELTTEVNKNLIRFEESTIKQMKIKLVKEQQLKLELMKREKIEKQLEEKLNKSKTKRQKAKEAKLEQMAVQRNLKTQFFIGRLDKIRRNEQQQLQRKIQKLHKKQNNIAKPLYNQIRSSTSLISQHNYQTEPASSRNVSLQPAKLKRLKELLMSKNAKIFQKRQLSVKDIRLRDQKKSLLNQEVLQYDHQKNGRLNIHLQRIKKEQQKKEEKIKLDNNSANYKDNSRSPSYEQLKLQQKRKDYLLDKLRKSMPSVHNPTEQSNSKTTENDLINSRNRSQVSYKRLSKIKEQADFEPTRNSILFEQGEERQKYSYRKQIADQIKKYIKEQKEKKLLQ